MYEEIPHNLRLRYAANRTSLEKATTYILLGIGKIPLRDGSSYDAAVLEDPTGSEIYVSLPIFLGLAFRKEGESWTCKKTDGGLHTIDRLEQAINRKIKLKDLVPEEVTNFQGDTVERNFPVWEIL